MVSIVKKNNRKLLVVFVILGLLLSCTKEERKDFIKEEITKENSVIIKKQENNNEYTYIINKRSGKVHNYTHGMNCGISEQNRLGSNDNIEEILNNEKYDICLTCNAGLKLNLEKYKPTNKIINDDEIDLTNNEVNLIKLYMNMYEFGKLDTETQSFLICIFEVGSWYVHNVYTQLGGQKNAREIDDIAEELASKGAYGKWRKYLDWYGNQYKFDENKKILPVVYDKNEPTEMVAYKCDLFKDAGYGKGDNIYTKTGMVTIKNAEGEEIDKDWKNYFVIDDSSKFATAVYYHYINKEILKDKEQEERTAYDIDLWGTGSEKFSIKSSLTKKLVSTNKFDLINLKKLESNKNGENIELYYENNKLDLKEGDLLYRNGHVEFYIGNSKVVNWGRVHKKYAINKNFKTTISGFLSDDIEDKKEPVVSIIRFKGGE